MRRAARTLTPVLSALFLALAGVALVAPPAQAATVTGTIDGVTYTADNTDVAAGATATAYDAASGPVVTIPASVNLGGTDYAVKVIGPYSFVSSGLTSTTLPGSLTTIGESAFFGNHMTSVSIPDNVATIGASAFEFNRLTTVNLGAGLTTIGNNAFINNLLTSVTIPGNVTTIGNNAFHSNKLTSVVMSDSVTSIGNAAFAYNLISNLTLSKSITALGFATFYTNRLTSVTLPAGLTTIGPNAFETNLITSVVIPAAVMSVDAEAFAHNTELTAVRFLGPAPTVVAASPTGSFDTTAGLTLSYPPGLGEPGTPGGYTTPTWKGYNAVPYQGATITGAPTANALVGQPFTYTPAVGGTQAPAVTLTSGTLPAGLALDATTGQVTGTPTASGSFPITLTATNASGAETLDVTITVKQEPSITGAPTVTGQVGQAFSYAPTVDGSPFPAVDMVSGTLPQGLALDASTGAITGSPTASGTFPIMLIAYNGVGANATLNVTITIDPAPLTGLAPAITGNPREGQTLTADEGPVSPASTTFDYQWMRYGTPIAGATNKTYKPSAADVGRKLSVTITASSPGQSDQTLTSSLSPFVSSPNKRLILNTSTVRKGQSFNLIATGLKPKQTYVIWLSGKKSYIGFTDANGMVATSAKFPTSTKPGTRRVRVSGYTNGKRTFTVVTHVTYTK